MNLMESLLANKLAAKQSSGGSDLTPEVKEALLDCFANVAWAVEDGQQYYDALQDALYGLQSISAVYTQSGTVYDTDSLDSLKADLVVTALYGDGSTQTVPAESYTLSGTLTEGTSTITVSYGGKTATFDVVVSEAPLLPSEYQEVEWISGNGGSYQSLNFPFIATGISLLPTAHVKIKLAAIGTQESGNFFGVSNSTSGAASTFGVISYKSAGNIGFYVYGGSVQAIPYDTNFHEYELSTNGVSVDGISYQLSGQVSPVTLNYPLWLFDFNAQGRHGNPASGMKIASVEIENGDNNYNFIPCYRKVDGEIGMFDAVNRVFYTNSPSSNGVFEKGADVN